MMAVVLLAQSSWCCIELRGGTKKLMGPPLISGVPLTNTKTKLDLTKLFSRYHLDNYLMQI